MERTRTCHINTHTRYRRLPKKRLSLDECFSILVGEGNITPDYFHTSLTFNEANLIIKGIQRRYRSQWECARWQTTFIAKCAGNSDYTPPDFYWEKPVEVQPPPTPEEMASIRAEADTLCQWMNQHHKNA